MKEQNMKNHIRFDPIYHLITVPLMLILITGSIIYFISTFSNDGSSWLSLLMLISSIALAITVVFAREYPKKVQDRVIRMEENFRHYRLNGELLSPELKLSQIIALRFAADDEFIALCVRAVKENLKPDEIKREISSWRADYLRV